MADKRINLPVIIGVQFLHTVIFIWTSGILVALFSGKGDGMILLVLWYTIPVYILEFLVVFKYHGNLYDKILPMLSVFMILSPAILQEFIPDVTLRGYLYCVTFGATVVIVASLYLLVTHFKEALEFEAREID